MAEFKRVGKVWVPYLDVTFSAGEIDALKNLLREWKLAGMPWDLNNVHREHLLTLHAQMNKPGGPAA